MLTSQSIPFLQLEEPGLFRLVVEEHHAVEAREQLRRYEEENRGFRLKRVLPSAAPFALSGAVLSGLAVTFPTLAQWKGALGHDWLAAGAARAGAIRSGDLVRTMTALTLHADLPHLLSNLVFGGLFSYLLFHTLGGGFGALALLAAGALGNLVNAWVQAPEHLSIGASTAVFGAIGLLGGSEWRVRHLLREPEARRFAPVGAAVLLLLYLGVGEVQSPRNVDVLAHVFGLGAGLALGTLVGGAPRALLEKRAWQAACGLGAGLALAASWALALTR